MAPVVVATCSMSFLPTGHRCVAKCDSLSYRIVDELLTKNHFSQTPLGLFGRNFLQCDFRSQKTFYMKFGAEIRSSFLTYFSPGRAGHITKAQGSSQCGCHWNDQTDNLFWHVVLWTGTPWQWLFAAKHQTIVSKRCVHRKALACFLEIWTKWDSNHFLN